MVIQSAYIDLQTTANLAMEETLMRHLMKIFPFIIILHCSYYQSQSWMKIKPSPVQEKKSANLTKCLQCNVQQLHIQRGQVPQYHHVDDAICDIYCCAKIPKQCCIDNMSQYLRLAAQPVLLIVLFHNLHLIITVLIIIDFFLNYYFILSFFCAAYIFLQMTAVSKTLIPFRYTVIPG